MAFSLRENWLIPLRAVQLLVALIVMGIDGSLVANDSWYNLSGFYRLDGFHSTFGYVIFVTVFTLIVTTYLFVVSLYFADSYRLAHPFLVGGLEALSWLWWLAAWAAMAGAVGLDRGDATGWICSREDAVVAFALIEWFLFCATAGYAAYQAWAEFHESRASRANFTAKSSPQYGMAV